MRCLFGSDLLGRLANQFLFDASGFTRTAAQIIKFSTAYIATAFYFNAGNLRGIQLESTFDCFARRNLADDNERVQATITLADNNAFLCLHTLAVAFDEHYINDNGIARPQ